MNLRKHLSDTIRDRIIAAAKYDSDVTIEQLVSRFGVARSTVQRVLKEAGIKKGRGRGNGHHLTR